MSLARAYNPAVVAAGINNGIDLEDLIGRGVGKTTYAVLAALASAGQNPGRKTLVIDPDIDTYDKALNVGACAKAMVAALGINGYTVQTTADISQVPGGLNGPGLFIVCNFAKVLP